MTDDDMPAPLTPPPSDDFLALLDAADADREHIRVTIGLPGNREAVVNFAASASSTAGLRSVKRVIKMFDSGGGAVDGNGIDRVLEMLDWLRTMVATSEDLARLDALDRRGYLDGPALRKLVQAVMQAVTGRPTTPSSSSAGGSPATGRTSTEPLPQPVGMPAPWDSTNS